LDIIKFAFRKPYKLQNSIHCFVADNTHMGKGD